MNKETFLKEYRITEDQFTGKEKINCYLDLSSLTSIPEGFNPTVGGWLVFKNGNRNIGATVDTNFLWQKNGRRYAKIDGLFCHILSEKTQTLQGKEYKLFSAKQIAKDDTFFIVNYDGFYAHGNDIHTAVNDLQFKIQAEKIKKEPILPDTTITVNHYRIITGACELGCKQWMEQNNITADSITAKELLPLLEKTNAYGLNNFKKLINW